LAIYYEAGEGRGLDQKLCKMAAATADWGCCYDWDGGEQGGPGYGREESSVTKEGTQVQDLRMLGC